MSGFAAGKAKDETKNVAVKHTEYVVERPIFKDKVIEVPRPVFIDRQVQDVKVTTVEKTVEVPVIKYVDVFVSRPVYVDVKVDRPVFVDVPVERPVLKNVVVEVAHKVPKFVEDVQLVKVDKVELVEHKKVIDVPVIAHRTVYVDKPVLQERVIQVTKKQFVCEKCGHIHEEAA